MHIGRVGADRICEPFGRALPSSPERVAQTSAVNRLFELYGVGRGKGASVSRVDLLDVTSISSNCNNVVIRVEAAESALPSTLFVKLPATNLWTRVFCNVLGIWSNECEFYANVAERVPFRVPEPFVVADQGSHFVLMLEDLHTDPSVELFTNLAMIEGVDVDVARKCLSTVATLHAAFEGIDPAERARMLPPELHPFASPNARSLSPVLSRAALSLCYRKAPFVFTSDMVDLCARAIDKYDRLLDFWFTEPLTLIHGDSHLGNFFISGAEMGMLDWQAVQWAKGIRDVQYFLINSMTEARLAEHERALVEHYASELRSRGVELSTDDAWAQYRAYSFQTLMTSVVSIGLSTMTDMDVVLRVLLQRSVAAVQRNGFADWLETL
jgi:hypothetical protein